MGVLRAVGGLRPPAMFFGCDMYVGGLVAFGVGEVRRAAPAFSFSLIRPHSELN